MKNKPIPLKKIFIKRMLLSAMIQFLVLGTMLIAIDTYLSKYQINIILNDLLIKDIFTEEQIAKYSILKNKYALDLELHSIGDEKKLDSIKFVKTLQGLDYLDTCKGIGNEGHKLCKDVDNKYIGISPVDFNNAIIGYILAKKQYVDSLALPVAYGLLIILIFVTGIFIFNFIFLFSAMKKQIETNTEYLLQFISHDADRTWLQKLSIKEYVLIAKKFLRENKLIAKLQSEKAYLEASKKIAAQVAHDIKSPLTALDVAAESFNGLPESLRISVRNAVARIHEIVDILYLQKNKVAHDSNISTKIQPELILELLTSLIAEKRLQFKKQAIKWVLNIQGEAKGKFINVSAADFKRVISNIINNSVEALSKNGEIIINLDNKLQEMITLTIRDNGVGLPRNILSKIRKGRGVTYGKQQGMGMGLSHANAMIKAWGGSLTLDSLENHGTTVSIKLKAVSPPAWFCRNLLIPPSAEIAILDDDQSIHDLWHSRLSEIMNSDEGSNLTIINLFSLNDFKNFKINNNLDQIFLIDYELSGEMQSGLDLIEQYRLGGCSYLVTSHYDDLAIRERCLKLGLEIIPKSFAPYISITQWHKPDLVFIDDNEALLYTWESFGISKGIRVLTFQRFQDFQKVKHLCDKQTPIYIDSDLHDIETGETYAKSLFEEGFTTLYLATGHDPEEFGALPYIRGIIGKKPPF